jgi:hypothetical protein
MIPPPAEVRTDGLHDIQGNSDIDTFFLGYKKRVSSPTWQVDSLIAIPKCPPKDLDTASAHSCKLRIPELVPEVMIVRLGNTGVEPDPLAFPALLSAQSTGKLVHVIVRPAATKRVLGCIEEILTINESDRTFYGRLVWHGSLQKITPPEVPQAGLIKRGVDKQSLLLH